MGTENVIEREEMDYDNVYYIVKGWQGTVRERDDQLTVSVCLRPSPTLTSA